MSLGTSIFALFAFAALCPQLSQALDGNNPESAFEKAAQCWKGLEKVFAESSSDFNLADLKKESEASAQIKHQLKSLKETSASYMKRKKGLDEVAREIDKRNEKLTNIQRAAPPLSEEQVKEIDALHMQNEKDGDYLAKVNRENATDGLDVLERFVRLANAQRRKHLPREANQTLNEAKSFLDILIPEDSEIREVYARKDMEQLIDRLASEVGSDSHFEADILASLHKIFEEKIIHRDSGPMITPPEQKMPIFAHTPKDASEYTRGMTALENKRQTAGGLTLEQRKAMVQEAEAFSEDLHESYRLSKTLEQNSAYRIQTDALLKIYFEATTFLDGLKTSLHAAEANQELLAHRKTLQILKSLDDNTKLLTKMGTSDPNILSKITIMQRGSPEVWQAELALNERDKVILHFSALNKEITRIQETGKLLEDKERYGANKALLVRSFEGKLRPKFFLFKPTPAEIQALRSSSNPLALIKSFSMYRLLNDEGYVFSPKAFENGDFDPEKLYFRETFNFKPPSNH